MEHKFGIHQLEQLTNEQVGAATKALLLTWLITADEVAEGEPATKLADGVLDLLNAQARDLDTELTMHVIGYVDNDPVHDRDAAVTPAHHNGIAAAAVVARIVARIIHDLS